MVVGTFTGGGIGVVVESLVKEANALGVEYTIVTKKSLAKTDYAEVIVHKAYSNAMRNALKKFDVVHAMGGSTLVVPSLMSKRPNVFTFQGQTPPHMHGGIVNNAKACAIEMLYKATMKRFDIITSASKFGQKDILERYGVKKSIWIPDGVDREMFHKMDNEEIQNIKNSHTHPLLLGVGNLYPVKDWMPMLDWFEEYLSEQEDASLQIIGDGILDMPMRRRIVSSRLKGHVELLGKLPYKDVVKYYNACDAYISGSPYEGFCLPAIEALACGKPLIVKNKGAMIEHALDSGCGAVFEDGQGFCKAAQTALSMNSEDVERKANEYLIPFTWKNAAEKYAELYKKLIGA